MRQRKKRHKQGQGSDFLEWTMPRLWGAGYGLFSRKAISPRWPEFFITQATIKKYRGKSSFWFMIHAALQGQKRHAKTSVELDAILARLVGSTPKELYRLAGIYEAMRQEHGPAVAMACVVEIIRITNEKRKNRLSWYRGASTQPQKAAPTARRTRRRGDSRGGK